MLWITRKKVQFFGSCKTEVSILWVKFYFTRGSILCVMLYFKRSSILWVKSKRVQFFESYSQMFHSWGNAEKQVQFCESSEKKFNS